MALGCLLVPDLPVAAALRAEPELRGHRLAITDGSSIVAGHLRGLGVAAARAVEPELVLRALQIEGIASAHEALVDVALSASPRIEAAEPGLVFVDLAGTEARFPSEAGALSALATRAHGVGLGSAQLGIGPTRTVAHLAARHRDGGLVVAEADVARFLAPLPIDLLDPPDDVFERLTRWGVRTLGALARIPREALGARLGRAGIQLARRACGEDLEPFRPVPPRLRFEEGVGFEFAVGNLETLSFALRPLLERLVRRLVLRGLAPRELWLELDLEDRRHFARRIELGAPCVEPASLLALMRLALERDPPGAAIERMRAIAAPGQLEPAQLDLFLPPLPAPAELAVTVARLEALCGPGNVGAPQIADTHRPDAARVQEFVALRRAPQASPDVLPRATLALRALRPPRAVRVREAEGLPVSVDLSGAQRVRERAGPWRLFGEWWGEDCFARDYFDVELSDGGLYRLYHDLRADRWFVDGKYD